MKNNATAFLAGAAVAVAGVLIGAGSVISSHNLTAQGLPPTYLKNAMFDHLDVDDSYLNQKYTVLRRNHLINRPGAYGYSTNRHRRYWERLMRLRNAGELTDAEVLEHASAPNVDTRDNVFFGDNSIPEYCEENFAPDTLRYRRCAAEGRNTGVEYQRSQGY